MLRGVEYVRHVPFAVAKLREVVVHPSIWKSIEHLERPRNIDFLDVQDPEDFAHTCKLLHGCSGSLVAR